VFFLFFFRFFFAWELAARIGSHERAERGFICFLGHQPPATAWCICSEARKRDVDDQAAAVSGIPSGRGQESGSSPSWPACHNSWLAPQLSAVGRCTFTPSAP